MRKSIRLGSGVRLNLGKRGISSVSVGRRGMRVSAGRRGVRSTVGIPGSGISYEKRGCALPGCVIPVLILAIVEVILCVRSTARVRAVTLGLAEAECIDNTIIQQVF